MGCSSASMFKCQKILRARDIEHCALVDDYLSSGSVLVLGNLWSVVDRDENRIVKKLIEILFDDKGGWKGDSELKMSTLRK